MTSAREEILARIRKSLGRESVLQTDRVALAERIARPPIHLQPTIDTNKVQLFAKKLQAVHAGFQSVGREQIMDAISRCLEKYQLSAEFKAAPELRDLSWPQEWQVEFGSSQGDDLISVTPCFLAAAETGSVVLLSSPNSPTSLNFLPDCHIVLVYHHQLVLYLEDVWPKLREVGAPPRSVNFITGPSKTADVEQTIQYGAHGPRSLEIIFVEN